MNPSQIEIKNEILEFASQQGKDVSLERILVAVSNNSGYNVASYSAFAQAKNHALGAGDAFSRSQPMPKIYVMVVDLRVKGVWELKIVDGESKLEWIE